MSRSPSSAVGAALVALFTAVPTSVWSATSSIYTSIAEEDCARGAELVVEGQAIRPAAGEALFKCSGPPGHALFIFDDGARSWYALEREGQVHSLKQDMIQEFRYGQFPNVPTSGVVEWRTVGTGEVAGLIFRISFQKQSESGVEPNSVLFVYNLQHEKPAFVGAAETNEEARELLDSSLE